MQKHTVHEISEYKNTPIGTELSSPQRRPTLIDHFTSLHAVKHLVYSYQLIKLELLTQSIRQQKLPPHRYAGIYLASDKLLIPIQLRRFILTGVISVVNLFIQTIRTKFDGFSCL